MKNGCFKNLFATVGCATVLLISGAAGWHFRAEIARGYRSLVGGAAGRHELPAVGYPTRTALRAAERKEAAIASRGGPGFVVLSADEMASLIEDRLDPAARRALDSIRVLLEQDRFSLEGQLLTDVFGRDLLGPLGGFIDPREPIRVSGMVGVRSPGIVAWTIDEFVVHAFPFPRSVIPRLVNRLTGDAGGILFIAVPATVGDLRIRTDGVTFYRRTD